MKLGCMHRFAEHTLKTGGNADAGLESADTVFVYDYCYMMRQAADSAAQRHWLLKDTYNGTRGAGDVLLKLYRCAQRRTIDFVAPLLAHPHSLPMS